MEPARPRAVRSVCGPRAGRLQIAHLRISIWRTFRHFKTALSYSLLPALLNVESCSHAYGAMTSLREIWQRSAEHDGWSVGNYIVMPDHVHFFARPEIAARSMAKWMQMWKSLSSRRIAAALSIKPPI